MIKFQKSEVTIQNVLEKQKNFNLKNEKSQSSITYYQL